MSAWPDGRAFGVRVVRVVRGLFPRALPFCHYYFSCYFSFLDKRKRSRKNLQPATKKRPLPKTAAASEPTPHNPHDPHRGEG